MFGSNGVGKHGAFAAKMALDHFGAIYGQPIGLQGQSYAIPTKDRTIKRSLDLSVIQLYVEEFICFASMNKNYTFLVTPIGCGAAGYKSKQIAPLFIDALPFENIHLPESFFQVILEYY